MLAVLADAVEPTGDGGFGAVARKIKLCSWAADVAAKWR
jgi:hypothetical protein